MSSFTWIGPYCYSSCVGGVIRGVPLGSVLPFARRQALDHPWKHVPSSVGSLLGCGALSAIPHSPTLRGSSPTGDILPRLGPFYIHDFLSSGTPGIRKKTPSLLAFYHSFLLSLSLLFLCFPYVNPWFVITETLSFCYCSPFGICLFRMLSPVFLCFIRGVWALSRLWA